MSEEVPVLDVQDVPETTESIPSAGQMLRTARHQAGLSVEDIAQALKFSPRQVESLEQDHYDDLPGNTIVRGFVRSYARYLKLDVAPLLHSLDARFPVAPIDVRPPDNMGIAAAGSERQQIGPMRALAIVVGVAALLLAIWHFFGPKPSFHPVGMPRGETANAIVPASVESSTTPTDATTEPTAVPASVQATLITGPAVPIAVPRLQLQFDDRSWVEVRDADGQTLYSGENLAGGKLSLDGKAPFDIVIGNAAKVKLTYDGRSIDLAAHTRAEVARLRLE